MQPLWTPPQSWIWNTATSPFLKGEDGLHSSHLQPDLIFPLWVPTFRLNSGLMVLVGGSGKVLPKLGLPSGRPRGFLCLWGGTESVSGATILGEVPSPARAVFLGPALISALSALCVMCEQEASVTCQPV